MMLALHDAIFFDGAYHDKWFLLNGYKPTIDFCLLREMTKIGRASLAAKAKRYTLTVKVIEYLCNL